MTADATPVAAGVDIDDQEPVEVAAHALDAVAPPPPLALVVFGASGDLASRKLLPAIAALAEHKALPDGFTVIGVARTSWTDAQFRKAALDAAPHAGPEWKEVVDRFRYVSGEYAATPTFDKLKKVLDEADATLGTGGNRVYYLATIPSMFGEVAGALADHGCNAPGKDGSFARIVVEKPFGRDLDSARTLDAALHGAFDEDQIFRIDHYLGKETVQNVLALRFANAIFEPIWNRRYVDHIQITVAEELGVEHRGGFYETAGALRDIVQNHVMQVLALTLMEPPATVDAQGIRDEKVKLLRAVMIPDPDEVVINSVRGQYTAGTIDGEPVVGYREEQAVDPNSRTETFVALRLMVDNWRWAGVPVYIRTGKRLPRATEVILQFQRVPHLAFGSRPARPAAQHARPAHPTRRGHLPVLRGQGPGRGLPPPPRWTWTSATPSSFPGATRRGLRTAPARRHDRRRHPLHPFRRGGAGLADRGPPLDGVGRRRGAPGAVPGGDLGAEGVRLAPGPRWAGVARALTSAVARRVTGKVTVVAPDDLLAATTGDLRSEARSLRAQVHGNRVTYSPKVFIPLTMLCRDRCGYCTFAKPPARVQSAYLSPDEVLAIARAGVAAGCHEALFTLGEGPEERYPAAHAWLDDHGFASTVDYLAAMCALVRDETGLLPHANAGALDHDDLATLRPVSASQGMMLESLDPDLACHRGAPDKTPARRLATLDAAGRLAIPFTTGVLVGIGESRAQRVRTLSAIADSQRAHGHMQEVIVQNFVPKPGTAMHGHPPCPPEELWWTIAVARLVLPPEVHVQAPPNLSDDLRPLLDSGLDDWGGVSPVTVDHVNPERAWPALDLLRAATEAAGLTLAARLTVYPEYAADPERWLDPAMRFPVLDHADADLLGREDAWCSGGVDAPPPAARHRSPSGPAPVPPARPARLAEVLAGVGLGQEVDEDQIVTLFSARGPEVRAVAEVADQLRRDEVGDVVTWVANRNINYTNVCTFKCKFCAFSKGPLSLNLRGTPYLLELTTSPSGCVEAEAAGRHRGLPPGWDPPEVRR